MPATEFAIRRPDLLEQNLVGVHVGEVDIFHPYLSEATSSAEEEVAFRPRRRRRLRGVFIVALAGGWSDRRLAIQ